MTKDAWGQVADMVARWNALEDERAALLDQFFAVMPGVVGDKRVQFGGTRWWDEWPAESDPAFRVRREGLGGEVECRITEWPQRPAAPDLESGEARATVRAAAERRVQELRYEAAMLEQNLPER